MKAFKSSVYWATAIEISWVSTVGRIWSFRERASSGLRMEIYYWSQNCASLKDTHDNHSFCLIVISISLWFIVQRAVHWGSTVWSGLVTCTVSALVWLAPSAEAKLECASEKSPIWCARKDILQLNKRNFCQEKKKQKQQLRVRWPTLAPPLL